MIAALKAEFRKVLSVRSSYVILGFSVVIAMLAGFYGGGLRYSGPLNDPFILQKAILDAVSGMAIFFSLIGLLLITHEYRYNTITYTLTANNSRTRVLLAKLLTISFFSILLILLIAVLSPSLTALGLHLKGIHVVHQMIFYRDVIWKVAFYGWGIAMLGAILAFLLRSQIGAIATLFLMPIMIDPLAGLVLKNNRVYLPFNSLDAVMGNRDTIAGIHISVARAVTVSLVYIVVGWLIAWLLFLRRDAN